MDVLLNLNSMIIHQSNEYEITKNDFERNDLPAYNIIIMYSYFVFNYIIAIKH